jgi:hypothetical protein
MRRRDFAHTRILCGVVYQVASNISNQKIFKVGKVVANGERQLWRIYATLERRSPQGFGTADWLNDSGGSSASG